MCSVNELEVGCLHVYLNVLKFNEGTWCRMLLLFFLVLVSGLISFVMFFFAVDFSFVAFFVVSLTSVVSCSLGVLIHWVLIVVFSQTELRSQTGCG